MDIRFWILLFVFLQTTYTDVRNNLIKNYITFPLMGVGIIYHLLTGEGIMFALQGLLISFLMTILVSVIIPNLGMGDMKLMMGIGALMGFEYAMSVYFYALILFILFYGLRKDLWKEIQHSYLTLRQAIETHKPVEKQMTGKGRALAPFIAVAGIAVYFFEIIYLI